MTSAQRTVAARRGRWATAVSTLVRVKFEDDARMVVRAAQRFAARSDVAFGGPQSDGWQRPHPLTEAPPDEPPAPARHRP